MKRILPIMAAILAMMLLFAACVPGVAENATAADQTQTEEPVPEKVENDPEQQELTAADDVIVTAYGELTFPGMWVDQVRYEIKEDGSDVSIAFYGSADGVEAPLYTLCYGAVPEDASEMGALVIDDDMVVTVSVVMHPIVPQQGWPEETAGQLQQMQESVNDLLVQLREYPNYTE